MNSGQESREVPVDVLPPLPNRSYAPTTHEPAKDRVPFEGLNTFYHPASGVVILGLDWLIFGTDLFTGFLALPAMCVLGFLVSFFAILAIQQKWSKDKPSHAIGKAFLGAFMVGVPFPITGTLLGAAILALSGLPHHPVEAVKRLVSQSTSAK
jgi:cytochrome bd-type quinol oxidase subunit 1